MIPVQCVLFICICPANLTDPQLCCNTGAQPSDTYNILFSYVAIFAFFLARDCFRSLLDDYFCGATLGLKRDAGGSQHWGMVIWGVSRW